MTTAPFSPSEVLLLGPGPSPVPPPVRAAIAAPTLGHLDPEFVTLMDRVQAGLRTLFGTDNRFTLPISGTGSAGMETVLSNLVEPGQRVVIGVNGVFGQRMADLCNRLGAVVEPVRAEPGHALDPEALRRAVATGPTSLLAVVHAETSTGVLQPLDPVAAVAREAGVPLAIDCVTSLGGAAVELDRLGAAAAFSGTQKCLSVPPGLAPVSLADSALDRVRARRRPAPTWYLDCCLLDGYWGGDRVYHHTAPVNMIYALAAGLDLALAEGLAARIDRHHAAAGALYRGLDALGLRCLVAEPVRTPMLTSVLVPAGVDEAAVRGHLRRVHRIEIGGGLGPLRGRIWRIGLMGHGAEVASVLRVLAALGDALAAQGVAADVGAALAAARAR